MRKLLIILTVCAWAAPAWPQVVPSQTGQALDSNLQLGSGGYNQVRGGVGGVNSQLYVTGQVSGLAGFRGNVPYFAVNQLNIEDIPSAGLSTFRQQSVGVSDVVSAQPYVIVPYFDASRTVAAQGIGRVDTGVIQPQLRQPVINSSFGERLYIDATAGYQAITPGQEGRQLYVEPPFVLSKPSQAYRPSGAVYGLLSSQDRETLARQLGRIVTDHQEGYLPRPLEIEARVEGASEAAPLPELPRDEVPPTATTETIKLPPRNQDVYVDVLAGFAQRRRGRVGEPVEGQFMGPQAPQRPQEETLERLPSSESPEQRRPPIVESTDSGVVIHGLAGFNGDLFNIHMAKGDNLLKDGKFYEAAGEYEVAAIVDPVNPVARLGMSLAYLGAGEPLSAGVHLERAMRLFPPLIEAKLNIAGMTSELAIRRQLQRVDDRSREGVDAAEKLLSLVGMHMYQNLNETAKAQGYARKLLEQAGDDPLLTAAANYVLTGKRPADTK